MRNMLPSVFALASILCALPVQAQSVYDEDLSQLSASVRAVQIRIERSKSSDIAGGVVLKTELFELSKKLHRLEEEAVGTDLEMQKQGNPPDPKLLLAASVAKALDLSQSLAGYYLETRENIFLVSSKQASQAARKLLSAM